MRALHLCGADEGPAVLGPPVPTVVYRRPRDQDVAQALLDDSIHDEMALAMRVAIRQWVPEGKQLLACCDASQKYTHDMQLLRRCDGPESQFARSVGTWSVPDLVEAFRAGLRPHDRVSYAPGADIRASVLYSAFLNVCGAATLAEFVWGGACIRLCIKAGLDPRTRYEDGMTASELRAAFEGGRTPISDLLRRQATVATTLAQTK